MLAEVTRATGSQRWGMATILVFFVAGLALLASTDDRVKG
jgi:MFS-type transporter involved in bile tolerance (Atg22 family)